MKYKTPSKSNHFYVYFTQSYVRDAHKRHNITNVNELDKLASKFIFNGTATVRPKSDDQGKIILTRKGETTIAIYKHEHVVNMYLTQLVETGDEPAAEQLGIAKYTPQNKREAAHWLEAIIANKPIPTKQQLREQSYDPAPIGDMF